MKKTGYIYGLYTDDKLFYVGSTSMKYPQGRYAYHLMNAYDTSRGKSKYKLYEYIRELGVNNIQFNVLETITYIDKSELLELEQAMIDKYDMYNKGYNVGRAKKKESLTQDQLKDITSNE